LTYLRLNRLASSVELRLNLRLASSVELRLNLRLNLQSLNVDVGDLKILNQLS
jgi:hypothetical protein